jgi:glycosyltransferase involved in cell wall biosynthesis
MRVALIDPSLFTWPYDSGLALGLQAAGHHVAIFGKSPRAADTGPALSLLRPHFYRGLESDFWQRLPRPLFLGCKGIAHVFDTRNLLAKLREFRPDVIHFQWAPLPVVDRHYIPLMRRVAPCVLTVHDSAPFNGNPRSGLQLAGAVSIMQSFDRLIVHTEAAAERLRGYGLAAEKIRRIPHGPLDSADSAERASLAAPRAERAPEDPVRILLFGRIKPYKGVDVLLLAAAQLSERARKRVRIHIVGQPFMDMAPLETLIRQLGIAAQVQLEPRFVADAEVASLLGAADIIALPYREIDASGVLMTAISAGVPIVASKVGLFAELLEDGRHGRLVAVEDHVGLGRALEQLVLDDALRARMGAAVRELRDALPSWQSIAGLTTQLYAELLTPSAFETATDTHPAAVIGAATPGFAQEKS